MGAVLAEGGAEHTEVLGTGYTLTPMLASGQSGIQGCGDRGGAGAQGHLFSP